MQARSPWSLHVLDRGSRQHRRRSRHLLHQRNQRFRR
ncbi:hypothetical protein ACRQ5Q_35980 [Bradyrhizobium sp. PMVTL-01]